MPGHGCTFLAGFTAIYDSTVRGRWQISRGGNLVQSLVRNKTDRSAKGHGEHLFLIHEGPLRAAKNTFALSAKAREGGEEGRGTRSFVKRLREWGDNEGTHKGFPYG